MQVRAYRDRDVLVLGASGFIGRWVARLLSQAGARLHLVARDPAQGEELSQAYGIRGEWLQADLADSHAASAVIELERPAVVFNLVGYGVDRSERDEQLSHRMNRDLPATLAEALARWTDDSWPGVRLVHAGSAFEYGRAGGDLAEGTPPEPCTLYGESKLAGTNRLSETCQETGLRGLTARLFTVYGVGEHAGRLLPSLFEAAQSDSVLELTAGLQRRDFTYVEDVAEGLLRLGCSGAQPGAVVNLATGRLMTVREFVQAAARQLGLPDEQLGFGRRPTGADEMEHAPVNTALLRWLTAWRPQTSVEEGVRKTAAFRSRSDS